MLAGNIEDVFGLNGFQHLIHRVELLRFRMMREVAGVNEKLRLLGQRVDLVDGGLQRAGNVRIGRLVEADVAVADLDKREVVFRWFRVGSQQFRGGHASGDRPDDTGSGPRHALQKASAVDTVFEKIAINEFFQDGPLSGGLLSH